MVYYYGTVHSRMVWARMFVYVVLDVCTMYMIHNQHIHTDDTHPQLNELCVEICMFLLLLKNSVFPFGFSIILEYTQYKWYGCDGSRTWFHCTAPKIPCNFCCWIQTTICILLYSSTNSTYKIACAKACCWYNARMKKPGDGIFKHQRRFKIWWITERWKKMKGKWARDQR